MRGGCAWHADAPATLKSCVPGRRAKRGEPGPFRVRLKERARGPQSKWKRPWSPAHFRMRGRAVGAGVMRKPRSERRIVPSPRLRGEGQDEGQTRARIMPLPPHPRPSPRAGPDPLPVKDGEKGMMLLVPAPAFAGAGFSRSCVSRASSAGMTPNIGHGLAPSHPSSRASEAREGRAPMRDPAEDSVADAGNLGQDPGARRRCLNGNGSCSSSARAARSIRPRARAGTQYARRA